MKGGRHGAYQMDYHGAVKQMEGKSARPGMIFLIIYYPGYPMCHGTFLWLFMRLFWKFYTMQMRNWGHFVCYSCFALKILEESIIRLAIFLMDHVGVCFKVL